ncbi:1-deoxy-D-xylulose-5-phosphate synthase [Trichococcus patagoniensis]|uniref:1-deoxy-D-xylulose-5-phosphate synthase n=1 Tax=Trichococcus patagoniensis TaxID=382641 RepID=A0A2T5IIX6_9LACT|nr:1-deoxy-D-xylulose-5-phosphate synthase [Trichococcus patagoniensis]PTQ83768.1 1-deoxy-D-xylulose-5-phosphate synthase [Trichococcus patagoniensis]
MATTTKQTPILDRITEPMDLKNMTIGEMETAAQEIRELVMNKVSKVGGHFGPNLGVVEMTLAFHYVFESPVDKIVWDVSHQSYPHKILTGRKAGFEEGSFDSVTGYTNPNESPHDYFNVGHTSTSVSLAVGLAKARDLKNEKGNVVAVIGDGSLSGGLAYEGFNNGADLDSNLIVVVNDNDMSIDKNYGGIYRNLAELRASNGEAANNLFKAFGFDYLYVEDGNDMETMIAAFEKVKDSDHPIVLHVHTEKGHGYQKATEEKMRYHWRTPFDLASGEAPAGQPGESYNGILMDYLIEKVDNEDAPIVAINAAIPGMFGLSQFQERHPHRYVDVGIAEAHSVTFASALSAGGARPVVFHSSTFLQRAYDQLTHDLALNENPAVIVIGGGTITKNAATHQGLFDIPLLSSIPNIKYLAPTSAEELVAMMDWALTQKEGPVAVRLSAHGVIHRPTETIDYAKPTFEQLIEGSKVAILALGGFIGLGGSVQEALAAKDINATLINPRFITNYDEEMLENLKANHDLVITLEDGSIEGGFGEKIARYYGGSNMKVLNFGAHKEFTDNVSTADLYERYHLTPELIVEDILKTLA